MQLFEMLGLAFVSIVAIMSFLWVIYLFYRNGTLVDIGKAVSFIAIAIIYFFMGEGFWLRKVVLMTMVAIWAVRLACTFIVRSVVSGKYNRYNQFTDTLKMSPMGVFYLLFILQGLLAIVLSIAFLPPIQNDASTVSTWEAVGALVWLFSVWGETIADYQKRSFDKDPANRHIVLQKGFWKYSRHPNYFFEWCVWVGFALFAMGSPWGWIAWISPILNLYLLVCVTGLPLSERAAEHLKGEAYRDYQRRTSAFFPWFPS